MIPSHIITVYSIALVLVATASSAAVAWCADQGAHVPAAALLLNVLPSRLM